VPNKGKRILVVEDNPTLLSQLVLYLGKLGYSVSGTNSGTDALCLAMDRPHPDLVFLDMRLPGMSGNDLLDKLEVLAAAAPAVIAMSGDQTELVKAKADHPTMVRRVILKPGEPERLQDMIESILGTPTTTTAPPDGVTAQVGVSP